MKRVRRNQWTWLKIHGCLGSGLVTVLLPLLLVGSVAMAQNTNLVMPKTIFSHQQLTKIRRWRNHGIHELDWILNTESVF